MSVATNVSLRTTYNQKIDYLAQLIEAVVVQIADLHKSHTNLCKLVYPTFFAVCMECKHEHEEKKSIEECEACKSKNIGYAFPSGEKVPDEESKTNIEPVNTVIEQ